MKTILVHCDFSKPPVNVFRLELDIARQSNTAIHLLNVVQLPVKYDSMLKRVLNFEQQLLEHLLSGSLAEDVVNHTNKLIWTYKLKNEPVEA